MRNGLIKKLNFWIYSVLNKIIPCCALTYLSLALIRMLYQSNERRHRLRSYGQAQTFYSQAASSSFYNAPQVPSGQLPVDLINSINAQKSRKSLPNSPNASNPNLLEQRQPKPSNSSSRLSPACQTFAGQTPTKMRLNESVSSTNLNGGVSLSALSPSKSQTLKLGWQAGRPEIEPKADGLQSNESLLSNRPASRTDQQQSDRNSNQSLNQSRNNSGASYMCPSALLNTSSSFNRSCRVNNNMNCDRTTRMLLAILILFLITELPSGIINLLSGILGEHHRSMSLIELDKL